MQRGFFIEGSIPLAPSSFLVFHVAYHDNFVVRLPRRRALIWEFVHDCLPPSHELGPELAFSVAKASTGLLLPLERIFR
ncbi:hypothetical protein GUJ93_ZPchr0001g31147 [Zizania palustris]|uniref:Uncharacterized protein n=1 Tax=Zizania palustris TaxID=103762 RepID=A0A8J5RNC2_ZIZPA|nr:hypothetical protein GUJ93_ZPchr0001g31147 [Zizania palustris]